jgi:Arc-like DNA binding domain.
MTKGGEKIGNIAPFGLRMLPSLRAQLEAAAQQSGRSLNAEIVFRLQSTLEHGAIDGRIDRMLEAFEQQQKIIEALLGKLP